VSNGFFNLTIPSRDLKCFVMQRYRHWPQKNIQDNEIFPESNDSLLRDGRSLTMPPRHPFFTQAALETLPTPALISNDSIQTFEPFTTWYFYRATNAFAHVANL